MHHINNAINWVSIKLNLPVVTILFINVSDVLKLVAIAATFSTLVYNGLRIHKEFFKKQNDKQ